MVYFKFHFYLKFTIKTLYLPLTKKNIFTINDGISLGLISSNIQHWETLFFSRVDKLFDWNTNSEIRQVCLPIPSSPKATLKTIFIVERR